MPSLLDVIRVQASRLVRSGVMIAQHADNALDEARELVLCALHLPRDFPANYGGAKILAHELAQVDALITERIDTRRPAAYLTGRALFAGIEFYIDERALIPRSPIGELIEKRFAGLIVHLPSDVLDLCTGSGCIGIATALHMPGTSVCLADISADALSLAQENIARHRLAHRVRCVQSDLMQALGAQQFDLILSNPPYVTDDDYRQMAAEYRHEPKLALTSGFDGLDHPLQILRDAPKHLRPGGHLILEIGDAWRALVKLLPVLDARWIEFDVGPMGILQITRKALLDAHDAIAQTCRARGL